MTNRVNADFLQILLCQLRQNALIDLVLAKASLILPKAKASEPVSPDHSAADTRCRPPRPLKLLKILASGP